MKLIDTLNKRIAFVGTIVTLSILVYIYMQPVLIANTPDGSIIVGTIVSIILSPFIVLVGITISYLTALLLFCSFMWVATGRWFPDNHHVTIKGFWAQYWTDKRPIKQKLQHDKDTHYRALLTIVKDKSEPKPKTSSSLQWRTEYNNGIPFIVPIKPEPEKDNLTKEIEQTLTSKLTEEIHEAVENDLEINYSHWRYR